MTIAMNIIKTSLCLLVFILPFYAQSSKKALAPLEDIKEPARKRAGKEPELEVFIINQVDGF